MVKHLAHQLAHQLLAPLHRQKAVRKVALGLAVSSNFDTLRDQRGINEIGLSELKTIKKLGEHALSLIGQGKGEAWLRLN